eukprot:298063_1
MIKKKHHYKELIGILTAGYHDDFSCAKNCDMNFDTLNSKSHHQTNQITNLTAKIQSKEKQLQNKMVKINMFRRMSTTMALGNNILNPVNPKTLYLIKSHYF